MTMGFWKASTRNSSGYGWSPSSLAFAIISLGCDTGPNRSLDHVGSSSKNIMEFNMILQATTDKSEYGPDERIRVDLTFVNQTKANIAIALPSGADRYGLFEYKLIDSSDGGTIETAELNPKGFVMYSQAVVSAGDLLTAQRRHLRFRTGAEWRTTPPPGRYRFVCVYNEKKLQGVLQTMNASLTAETPEFLVRDR